MGMSNGWIFPATKFHRKWPGSVCSFRSDSGIDWEGMAMQVYRQ